MFKMALIDKKIRLNFQNISVMRQEYFTLIKKTCHLKWNGIKMSKSMNTEYLIEVLLDMFLKKKKCQVSSRSLNYYKKENGGALKIQFLSKCSPH